MRQVNTKDESLAKARDTGLAMVLLCLLLLLAEPRNWLTGLAVLLLLITMIRPQLFAPLARLWFAFSQHLGTLMTRLLLTLIFFTVVTPIALLRRLMGADSMQRKHWRQPSAPVFKERNQTYSAADLERPY